MPFTFAAGPLAPMLAAFLTRYPDVRVILTVDNRNVDLLTEEIDIAIRIGPLADSELIARRLASIELWPCASATYLSKYGVPERPKDLSSHAIIAHSDREKTWRFVGRSGSVKEVELASVAVIPEPAVVRTMVIAGAGIGWLPDFYASGPIAEGSLVRVLQDFGGPMVEAYALYPSHRSLSAKVRVFIDAVVEHLASR